MDVRSPSSTSIPVSLVSMPVSLPLDVLEQILRILACDGEDSSWFCLAYLTCKREELQKRAKSILRPLVVHIEISPEISRNTGGNELLHSTSFVLPIVSTKFLHVEVDWGDGSPSSILTDPSHINGANQHEYGQYGEYIVRIFPRGDPAIHGEPPRPCWLEHFGWDGKKDADPLWWVRIRSLKSWGSLGIRSFRCLFRDAADFNLALPCLGIETVTNLSEMFLSATNFNHQSLSKWNVCNVTNMKRMFQESGFDQPIGQWNVSKVTTMEGMFQGCKFNQPIGSWNVSSVVNMGNMFSGSCFNQPIGSWDVSRVTRMAYMFGRAADFNQPIGDWNVSNVTMMRGMFGSAVEFNQPLEKWDVSKVTSMAGMFAFAKAFDQPSATGTSGKSTTWTFCSSGLRVSINRLEIGTSVTFP